MTDRPIIFSAPMVRALLAGRKSQTRRVLKPQPTEDVGLWLAERGLPYAVGDRLWVREACFIADRSVGFDPTHGERGTVGYIADGEGEWTDRALAAGCRKRPSIHMPRWASRLTLAVTDVRVQRLCSISEDEARAEGVKPVIGQPDPPGAHRVAFAELWDDLHEVGPASWSCDPWVVAIAFETHRFNIDQMPESAP